MNAQPRRETVRKLSVLMPVYNERWTLKEIIDRVFAAPVTLEMELIAVDDGSSDGSWELLQEIAAENERVIAIRHTVNRGKGAAIRTAIEHMTGDVAVIQDADLEYDPGDYPVLLAPIVDGRADAVFGSRFAGNQRRVLFFWHMVVNKMLTLLSNAINDLNLTDMETCYKAVRSDVLKRLRLRSDSFTIEPELTCRLAQWGARIYEVPVSYAGRTYCEGKKIRPIDGLKAIGTLARCGFVDTKFTDHSGFYILASLSRANEYNRWLLSQVQPFLGDRLLEAGAGIGNLSSLQLNRERLVLVDYEEMYVSALRHRLGSRGNVRIERADITDVKRVGAWKEERLDTILCSNVLEHLGPDDEVLRAFHDTLQPGGHCVIVVPAGKWLHTVLDDELGHYRRYQRDELAEKMQAAGFEIVFDRTFNRFGSLCWAVSGHLLRRRHLSPRQMKWFDRLLPLIKLFDHVLPVPGMSLIMVGRKRQKEMTSSPAVRSRAA